MKKLILIILIISCVKSFKNIDLKDKNIDENLFLAVDDNNTYEAMQLIENDDDINYIYKGRSILDVALSKKKFRYNKNTY